MKKRPVGQKRVLVAHTSKPMEEKEVESDSDASVKDTDDEKEVEQAPIVSTKKVKRRVKKVVRKSVTAEE
jgi:hypothetical protein